ncbi:MAG: hypothetical protein KZQ85_00325 [Candidatus Thiodiazotropha sp. (ex Myrtea sp. 'scaly one' KF741663)]|nr:hypothetical protein [Candidatus Thiodiazotropha sp. (ex Myrtea sp. 'scaly one' KF741663)]
MMAKYLLLFLLLFSLAKSIHADSSVIIQVGGGNTISNSQGQIEDNVEWLSKILKKSSNTIKNYYAAGNTEEKDVAFFDDTDSTDLMQPLSRVFDFGDAHRLRFKINGVPELSGSTRKDELSKSILNLLNATDKESEILIVFNGHGDLNEDDVRYNTIKVWGDEKLDVGEVDGILDSAHAESLIRFVFPQCYSGGFYHLIYEDPESNELAKQNRCGFFAESPYDQSEGCSLNTNKEEYRDYSTYFFAPLNGATRNGQELPVSVDINNDGSVSYRESHIYALMVGESKDLSRSSSEMYLEEWTPWYLRWSSGNEDEKSIYWSIAEYLASKHDLGMDRQLLKNMKSEIQENIVNIKQLQQKTEENIEEVSSSIKLDIKKYWPELFHPYTLSYISTLNKDIETVSSYIQKHKDYPTLVSLQTDLTRFQGQELDYQRKKAQIDKITRMKLLARLTNYFSIYATDKEVEEYSRLLACENGVFFKNN